MKLVFVLPLTFIAAACDPSMPAIYGQPPAPPAQSAPPPTPPPVAAAPASPPPTSTNSAAASAAAAAGQQMADQRTQAGAIAANDDSTAQLMTTFNLSLGAAKADSAQDVLASELVAGTAYTADAHRFVAAMQAIGDAGNRNVAGQMAAMAAPVMNDAMAAIKQENACRADASCTNDRAGAQICQLIAARRGTEAQIAQEKKNTSGVVDLAELHQLGATVQHLDEQIAGMKSNYRATIKKPFDAKSCANAVPPSQ